MEALKKTWAAPPGFIGWLSQVNHKAIGKRYLVTGFVFFLVAGIDALRMRFHREIREGAAGSWRQENAASEPVAPFYQVDLSSLPASRFREAFAEPARAAE